MFLVYTLYQKKYFIYLFSDCFAFFLPPPGMMLPGYVPTRGNYNETYLKVIQGIVSKAASFGIYTLLDMHQDVMSAKFCVEGFPDWAVNTGNDIIQLLQ